MSIVRSLKSLIILATVMAIGVYGASAKTSLARGGGHGGGGHGGGHAGGHGGARHPYHPSAHHNAGHRDDHRGDLHNDHHWNHHHHDWHHAGWGWNPGFWGGLGVGYGVGAWAGWPGGGGTYVDNSNSGNTVDNSAPITNNSTPLADNATAAGADDNNPSDQLAVDVWPELGISTYSGEYGKSQGLVVVRVMPHSAGDLAGLVPGDVILKLNGQPTPDDEALESVLDKSKGEFNLLVWDARTGRKSTIAGKLDANASEEAAQVSPSGSAK